MRSDVVTPAPSAATSGTQHRLTSRKRSLGAPIRVGLVDDHPIVRASIRGLLEEQPDMQVVGEADCGRAAIDMVRSTPLDVVLLDIDMPRQGGMDAISLIKAKANELGVIVFSSHPEKEYAVPLIRGGASAYLHKSCDPGELLDAIRKVGNGGSYITPQVADLLATQLLPARGMFPHEQLSSRELQVFLKLARGMAPGEVAQELSLSAKTVSSYRARVLQKLEARSNADLTYYALKHGLLD